MKLLKWILGIPIAFGIIIALATIIVDSSEFKGYFSQSLILDAIAHFLTVFSLFFILVLLSCLLATPPKKYAATVTLYITYTFAVVCVIFDFFVQGNPLNYILNMSYLGLFTGPITAFFICFRVFDNKGWQKT